MTMDHVEPGTVDPFAKWFVDMIQAPEIMTDAELERVVSEADPAMMQRLERIMEAMFRQGRR